MGTGPAIKYKRFPEPIKKILDRQQEYHQRNILNNDKTQNAKTIAEHTKRLKKIKTAIQTGKLSAKIKEQIKNEITNNRDDINRTKLQLDIFAKQGLDVARKEWDNPKNSFRGKLDFNDYLKSLESGIKYWEKLNKVLQKYI